MTLFEKVRSIYPQATPELVEIYRPIVEQAEACLAKHGDDSYVITMQAMALAHLISASQSHGEVTSESTRTGASASYAVQSGRGINSTRYGRQLAGLPGASCLTAILAPPKRFARSINVKRWPQ